jgi:hypothetical protein
MASIKPRTLNLLWKCLSIQITILGKCLDKQCIQTVPIHLFLIFRPTENRCMEFNTEVITSSHEQRHISWKLLYFELHWLSCCMTFLELSNIALSGSVMGECMSMEHQWNETDRANLTYADRNSPTAPTSITDPDNGSRSASWQADNRLPEPRHCLAGWYEPPFSCILFDSPWLSAHCIRAILTSLSNLWCYFVTKI